MQRLVLLAVCAPAVAFAQPGPYDPNAGSGPYAPPPNGPPAGPPPATYGPPPPGYGYAPYQSQTPTTEQLRTGATVELNLGFGYVDSTEDGAERQNGIAGLSLGVGGWVSRNIALTARVAGVTFQESFGNDDLQFSHFYLGPSAQFWIDNHLWFGGGLGLSVAYVTGDGESDSTTGVGMDLRGGYTFNEGSESTFNVSLEINPGWYEDADGTLYGVGLLVGYQHL